MTLTEAQKQDYTYIKKLYLTAFPSDERAPFFFIRRRAMQGRASMLVAKEGEAFIGFAYIVGSRDAAYLFYFAVDDSKRGCGNGSKILTLLREKYANRKLFLAREQLDPSADNYPQRLKRREFYQRNGFCDLSCKIQEASVVYDVMSIGGEKISADEYDIMMSEWMGKFFRRLITVRFIE